MTTQPSASDDARKPNSAIEPEVVNEDSVPLDGKDHEGEKMMEELGHERRKDGTAPGTTGDKVPEQPKADPLPKEMPMA